MDADGDLTMGTGDGLFYVAEVDIPPKEYEEQEPVAEGQEEGGTAPVAKPLDMSQVTVTLWGLENPVAADDEEAE